MLNPAMAPSSRHADGIPFGARGGLTTGHDYNHRELGPIPRVTWLRQSSHA